MAKNAYDPSIKANIRTGGTGGFQNLRGPKTNPAPAKKVVYGKPAVGPMPHKVAPQNKKTAGAKKYIGSLV